MCNNTERNPPGAQNSQIARPSLGQPQDPRIEPERARRRTANLHDRVSDNSKIPGSSPSRRAEEQPNCTTEAPTTARPQDRARAGAQKTSQIARQGLRQPQNPRIEPERARKKQPNCTTGAPTTARSQDRARAAASSDPKLWMTAAGFDPGPSRRRARWQTAAPEPPGDFPGGPERGSAALYVGLYESAQNHRQRLRVDLAKLENFDRCEIRAPPEFRFLTAGGLLNQREEPLILQNREEITPGGQELAAKAWRGQLPVGGAQ